MDEAKTITLNGRPSELRESCLGALLQRLGHAEAKGIAVALNDEVIPKSQWSATPVAAGDRLEIVVAVQGG